MTVSLDPRTVHAPEAYDALVRLEGAVAAAVPDALLIAARRRVAMQLSQAAWEPTDDPVEAFVDQFVIDVSSADVAPVAERLGPDVGPFVFGLWATDLGLRTDIALSRLFGVPCPPREPVGGRDLPEAFDEFTRAVARLDAVDPVTTELARLRVARFHDCRLCKSLRSAAAIRRGADDALFAAVDRYESSDLAEPQKVALRLTDAVVGQPAYLDQQLASQVRAHFDDAQVTELVLDVMRNAANKIAVAFRADAPHVAEGVELFDVLPDGEVVYGLTEAEG